MEMLKVAQHLKKLSAEIRNEERLGFDNVAVCIDAETEPGARSSRPSVTTPPLMAPAKAQYT